MRTLLNIIWLLLCGWWIALLYAIAGVVMRVLIITIPFGLQAFKLAGLHALALRTVPSFVAVAPSVVGNVHHRDPALAGELKPVRISLLPFRSEDRSGRI